MVHAARGGKNYGASRCECQADQTLAGDFEIGQTVGGNLYDPARARQRCGDIQIAIQVKGQTLRPSQTLVEGAHRSVGTDFVNAVRGAGHEQVTSRTERQMVSRNADFERGEDKDLLIAGNLEDGAVAVADVKTLLAIKC